jgi:MGT family glycosyltransferase
MLTVAQRLAAAGHRVRVMSDACNQADAEAAGAVFAPWTMAPSRPDRRPESEVLHDWKEEGPAGLTHAMDVVWTGPALAFARDVMAELRREPADLVVTSEMLFGVAVGCEALGQPFCVLTANVSLFPIPGVPPLGPGLAPARTEAERAMHAEIAEGVAALFDHGLPAVNAARAALGLPPLARALDQMRPALATLIGTARAFDFAPEVLPDGFSYIGPQLGEPGWARPWSDPFGAGDERPLVLVSFSTTFQNHAGDLQRVIDALASRPVRAVVTLGGSIDASDLVAAPNVLLVDSAPHDQVMANAALVVTHGGHGTVVRALAHECPLLIMPHGRDQNDNAVRVTERGAGLALPADAGVEAIGDALDRLLSEPSFAAAARSLGVAIAGETRNSPVVAHLQAVAAKARTKCPA